jgi:hypothetical protein
MFARTSQCSQSGNAPAVASVLSWRRLGDLFKRRSGWTQLGPSPGQVFVRQSKHERNRHLGAGSSLGGWPLRGWAPAHVPTRLRTRHTAPKRSLPKAGDSHPAVAIRPYWLMDSGIGSSRRRPDRQPSDIASQRRGAAATPPGVASAAVALRGAHVIRADRAIARPDADRRHGDAVAVGSARG